MYSRRRRRDDSSICGPLPKNTIDDITILPPGPYDARTVVRHSEHEFLVKTGPSTNEMDWVGS